jgi:hypothetical protein
MSNRTATPLAALAFLSGLGSSVCLSRATPAPAASNSPLIGRSVPAAADQKAADKKEDPKGDPIEVSKLPKAVVTSVKKALPGAKIVKAAKLPDGNYFLDDVKVGKKEYDVTITPAGKILKKVEQKDND